MRAFTLIRFITLFSVIIVAELKNNLVRREQYLKLGNNMFEKEYLQRVKETACPRIKNPQGSSPRPVLSGTTFRMRNTNLMFTGKHYEFPLLRSKMIWGEGLPFS